MISMSQEKLGDTLGITFQQVQKYEKGTNHIGASRLQHIAHILHIPFLFRRCTGSASGDGPSADPGLRNRFPHNGGRAGADQGLHADHDPKLKRSVIGLVEEIADGDR
jgi:transcriptional regulator with XRE-family HTH domain